MMWEKYAIAEASVRSGDAEKRVRFIGSCLIIAAIFSIADGVYFLVWLSRRYSNIFTLDGKFHLSFSEVFQYLFRSIGGVFTLGLLLSFGVLFVYLQFSRRRKRDE